MTDKDQAYNSLKIFDTHGRLVHSVPLGFNRINTIDLPGNVGPGMYTVLLEANGLAPFQGKLVILN